MSHYPKPFFRKSRQLWYVQLNGRQFNLGPDRDEAFTRYHELMAKPEPKVLPTTAAPLVVVLCDRFLDWVQLHRSAGTYQWYWWRLQKFVRKYPELTADELQPFHVQEWVDSLHVAATTQRNCIRAVKRSLRWAQQQGYIKTNPITELEAPSPERREVVIAEDEYQRLLEAIPDPAFYNLVVTSWETGCRPQESLRVEARHVDLKNQRWVFPKSESKTKRIARVVYLTDTAFEITARLVRTYPTGRLFRNSNGKPWTNYAVQCAFQRLRIRLGKAEMQRQGSAIPDREINNLIPRLAPNRTTGGKLVTKTAAELRAEAKRKLTHRYALKQVPNYSLYALRHSWATRALQQGVDSLTVAILMGHQDPSMLARVYQHLSLNPQHLLKELKRVAS